MGSDKSQLVIDDVTMLERTVATLKSVVAERVFVVGGQRETEGSHYVADRFPGEGPVGAVVSALAVVETDALLVVSCDLPALRADLLGELLAALETTDADYVVPLANGRRQWHCMGFHKRCYEPLAQSFESGARSYHDAVHGLGECAVLSRRPGTLLDIDTPEQYRRYCESQTTDE